MPKFTVYVDIVPEPAIESYSYEVECDSEKDAIQLAREEAETREILREITVTAKLFKAKPDA